ncbi:hypothetical protein A3D81_01620 [Candidatus Curtissbacteria bacterium RIFCSPHIGHO2_02_FULL_40_17]|uniref:Carbohydrate kinase PfkB domain-containing protein n=4 Tax=Candidatus Curtissiibacteriota TaxID=1752717 RepID=A0A1F5GH20_9BACT|nr:MAG: hypothetical protein A2693_03380 [Candidatus Curtissbacteria bacterium RIFCSPHIGHO2_01_FULL_40_12]OGD91156.1 MAG: hypothetical protein A3D81_01620 [Candidatus Curtissbacteria bacterium RIFCSPHIGHO2_02_FULL_40_17]OGE05460.1 MAG: hypothetical protein A3F45_03715 [Candidatus Curtissbacteria bacterium RIFCSPHIGHO2_12_FULL_41_17]OGE07138.1 MAG: hypothetical protein A3I53_02985 [Candidatus Curtissbacteria bacterium RIFCSPLOWO2_02_FULL_40_13b]
MENKFDIITIGDSTIDTFIKIHDATVECDINHEDCKICISYGDKIPVDSIGHEVAGNAANVAVGCAVMGLKTAIYTNLGVDQAGSLIKKVFEESGVSTEFVKVHQNKESNLSVVLTFQGERTIFVYHQPWSYSLPQLSNSSWIYLTSMAESFTNSNITDEICHYLDKSHAKLAFAPGTYQLKADVKLYPKILERSELLIVNLEEAKKILNIKEAVEAKTLLAKLLLLGPKTIIITDGAEGSYATDGQRNLRIGIFPTQLVEKTGAGDAYSSGLLTALILGYPLETAMVWGTINASKVIGRIGPQKGLLRKNELENYLKAASNLVATPF